MSSLRRNILLIGLLPALVASSILAIAYLWHNSTQMQSALDAHGKRLALQIAPMQEYPLFTGNEELLKTQLLSALQLAPEVTRIEIIRRDYSRAAFVERPGSEAQHDHRYRAPILASYSGVEDYADLLTESVGPDSQILGWVELTLSDASIQAELTQRYLWLGASLLVAVLIAYLLGIRLAHGLARPIDAVLQQTQTLESGNYQTDFDQTSLTQQGQLSRIRELAQLQRALSRLARVLRHREEENRAALEALKNAQQNASHSDKSTDEQSS